MQEVIRLQRYEGLAYFLAASAVYFWHDYSMLLYILLFFSFDVSMLGYRINRRIGAIIYNLGHSLIAPAVLVVIYVFFVQSDVILGLACLWTGHIGLDRFLGYGLKLPIGFVHTHLGDIKVKKRANRKEA